MTTFDQAMDAEVDRIRQSLRMHLHLQIIGQMPADEIGPMWTPTWPSRAAARVGGWARTVRRRVAAAVFELREGRCS